LGFTLGPHLASPCLGCKPKVRVATLTPCNAYARGIFICNQCTSEESFVDDTNHLYVGREKIKNFQSLP